MDVGGTMAPYYEPVSRLFTALHEERGLRDFVAYYFHNCIYDHVFTTGRCCAPTAIPTADVLRRLDARWKVVIVGDAAMHPAELLEPFGNIDPRRGAATPGLEWLRRIADALRPQRVGEPRSGALLGRQPDGADHPAPLPDVPPERGRARRRGAGARRRARLSPD